MANSVVHGLKLGLGGTSVSLGLGLSVGKLCRDQQAKEYDFTDVFVTDRRRWCEDAAVAKIQSADASSSVDCEKMVKNIMAFAETQQSSAATLLPAARPARTRAAWTLQEDLLLLEKVDEVGPQWTHIANEVFANGHTRTQIARRAQQLHKLLGADSLAEFLEKGRTLEEATYILKMSHERAEAREVLRGDTRKRKRSASEASQPDADAAASSGALAAASVELDAAVSRSSARTAAARSLFYDAAPSVAPAAPADVDMQRGSYSDDESDLDSDDLGLVSLDSSGAPAALPAVRSSSSSSVGSSHVSSPFDFSSPFTKGLSEGSSHASSFLSSSDGSFSRAVSATSSGSGSASFHAAPPSSSYYAPPSPPQAAYPKFPLSVPSLGGLPSSPDAVPASPAARCVSSEQQQQQQQQQRRRRSAREKSPPRDKKTLMVGVGRRSKRREDYCDLPAPPNASLKLTETMQWLLMGPKQPAGAPCLPTPPLKKSRLMTALEKSMPANVRTAPDFGCGLMPKTNRFDSEDSLSPSVESPEVSSRSDLWLSALEPYRYGHGARLHAPQHTLDMHRCVAKTLLGVSDMSLVSGCFSQRYAHPPASCWCSHPLSTHTHTHLHTTQVLLVDSVEKRASRAPAFPSLVCRANIHVAVLQA